MSDQELAHWFGLAACFLTSFLFGMLCVLAAWYALVPYVMGFMGGVSAAALITAVIYDAAKRHATGGRTPARSPYQPDAPS